MLFHPQLETNNITPTIAILKDPGDGTRMGPATGLHGAMACGGRDGIPRPAGHVALWSSRPRSPSRTMTGSFSRVPSSVSFQGFSVTARIPQDDMGPRVHGRSVLDAHITEHWGSCFPYKIARCIKCTLVPSRLSTPPPPWPLVAAHLPISHSPATPLVIPPLHPCLPPPRAACPAFPSSAL